MRESICGIGTNRLKRFLGRKNKEGDKVAEIFRTALNLEDANIRAKKYSGSTYSDHYYDEKEGLLGKLIDLFRNSRRPSLPIMERRLQNFNWCSEINAFFHYQGLAYFRALMSGTNSPAVTSRSCFKNIVIYTGR